MPSTLVKPMPVTASQPATTQPPAQAVWKYGMAVLDQSIVSATRFATTVFLSRVAGEAQFGLYSLAFQILTVAVAAQEALIAMPFTVFVADKEGEHRQRFLGSALIHFALLGGAISLGLSIAAGVWPAEAKSAAFGPVLAVLAGVLLLLLARDFARRLGYAHHQVAGALRLDSAMFVLQLAGLAALFWLDSVTARSVLIVAGLASGLPAAAALWHWGSESRFRWADARRDFAQNSYFARWEGGDRLVMAGIAAAASWWLLLVAGGNGDRAAFNLVAELTACQIVVMMTNPLVLGVSSFVVPHASSGLKLGGHRALRRIAFATAGAQLAVLSVFVAIMALFGPELIRLIYKLQHVSSEFSIAVWILAGATIPNCLLVSAGGAFRAMQRPDVSFLGSVVGLAVATGVAVATWQAGWQLAGVAAALASGHTVNALLRWSMLLWMTKSGRQDARNADQGPAE